ncbi:hypothetical protein ROU88_11485 [Macrococcus capreoli]|uniref:hypothetical protein n=1 Tax=Macrococcus capreoli TaxID=2982690 RepID=UPI0021D60C1D|nr:hypothetical protein [Macrococcus sp. TMW 2.2395]MCU7557384.1 hypothetical protein [Macrococcus sp. TMW 2.2395]
MFKTYTQLICEEQALYHLQPIETIVKDIQNGNVDAFESLVARLRNGIAVHIRRLTFKDHDALYQESLITLYQAVRVYDPLKSDDFERFYFYHLKYALLDYVRGIQKERKRPIVSIETSMYEDELTLDAYIQDINALDPRVESEFIDLQSRMTPIALQLSPIEYRVLEYLKEQMPIKAMAAIENESLKTIHNTIARLKVKVKTFVKGVS